MYVIKVEDDKSLISTIKSTIYKGERNADILVFLVPKIYSEKNIADCTVFIRYILPSGEGRSEELELDVEPYKGFYKYRLKVGSRFTDISGKIELWLSAIDSRDSFVLKTGPTTVEVSPSKKISDYLSESGLDELDKLNLKIQQLSETKADNITYDESEKKLQLSAQGVAIGNKVDISSANSDDVIDVDPIDVDTDETDELIKF